MTLQIQCPKCSKRFTIHEDLVGKTVECGSCEHRFPVKKEMVIYQKPKVYPGEQKGRSDDFFNRLGRQPGGTVVRSASRVAPESHAPQVDAIMPASPARNMAAAAGFGMLLLYGMIFLVGTSQNGIFQDVDMVKRIILLSFVSVLSLAMVIYGAKNWRFQATMLALVLVASLAAANWIRPVLVTPTVDDRTPIISKDNQDSQWPVVLSDAELKAKVGYEAVNRRLRLLEDEFGAAAPNHLVAIFVERLKPGQYFKLEQYLNRAFEIPAEEGINRYERGADKRDCLMLISGFQIDFEEAVRLCDPKLGRATTYPELRLIELKLSALHDVDLADDPETGLGKPGDLSYFAKKYKALSALNPDQVKNAVKNLSTIPDDIDLEYQEEIVVEFMRLLGTETDEKLLNDLGKAFRRWGKDNQAALTVVADKVATWIEDGGSVSSDYLEYLIENSEPRALAFVDELWSAEPEFWSRQYTLVGPVAEPRLIEHLESSPLRLRKAAAAILGSIGGEASATALAKQKDAADDEFRLIVERAIQAINAQ
jgi:predicted Zn finger-like uncharacterized protein